MSPRRQGAEAPRRTPAACVQRMLLVLVVLGLATFAASTVRREPGSYLPWADAWLYPGIGLLAAVTCALRVRRDVGEPHREWSWLFLAGGLLALGLGDVSFAIWVSDVADPPYPSVADFCYLAFFPAAYVALVLLLRRSVSKFLASTWLDGAVAGLGSAAIAWVVGFDELVAVSGGDAAEVLVNLSYPAGDLLLLTVSAACVTAVGWRRGRELWLLIAGLGLFAVADTVYALQDAHGTYVEGGTLDVTWPLAYVLLALASTTRPAEPAGTPEAARTPTESWWSRIVVPGGFTLAAVIVLTLAGDGPARYLAAATVLVAALRAALTFREVSALGEARRQARTDDLTGLLNRRGFLCDLDAALGRRETVGVLILDLDRFKEVNDALGHHVGDRLLRLVAARISARLGDRAVLARLGGDEFAVLTARPAPDGADVPETGLRAAVHLAREICEAMLESFDLGEIRLHVGVSIGAAGGSADSTHTSGAVAAALLQQGDVAMYDAKTHGGGYRVYDATTHGGRRDRLRTVEELRTALESEELVLHYQPKIDLPSGTVAGVEALVRWAHPHRGLLAPGEFLPLAEQAGLMPQLTGWVLRTALAQVAEWRADGLPLVVAVNVSASNLLDLGLVDQVDRLLRVVDLPAGCLQIELTENTMMSDPTRATQVIGGLAELGVAVSIDDYGIGYSSLAYLRDLPVSELKLDRTFVDQVGHARSGAIVRSTVELAHALGLRMVAEGVEDAGTARSLASLGCDTAQGFHYARPIPAARLRDWIAAQGAVAGPLVAPVPGVAADPCTHPRAAAGPQSGWATSPTASMPARAAASS